MLEKIEKMKDKELYFKILEKEKGEPLAYMASVHGSLKKYDSDWDNEVLGEKYRALVKKYPNVNKTD